MAKVIEFYIPKNCRKSFVHADQPKPGKVIEFCPQVKKSLRIGFGTRLMRNSALRLSLLRSSHRSPYVELRIA